MVLFYTPACLYLNIIQQKYFLIRVSVASIKTVPGYESGQLVALFPVLLWMLLLDKLKPMKKLLISAMLYFAVLSLFNYFFVWVTWEKPCFPPYVQQ